MMVGNHDHERIIPVINKISCCILFVKCNNTKYLVSCDKIKNRSLKCVSHLNNMTNNI